MPEQRLQWVDTHTTVPEAIPGVRFTAGRWVVCRVSAEDPRHGWAVYEAVAGRYLRRADRAHLPTCAEGMAVAETLDSGLLRHVLRAADFGLALATAAVLAWSRRWSGATVRMAPPPPSADATSLAKEEADLEDVTRRMDAADDAAQHEVNAALRGDAVHGFTARVGPRSRADGHRSRRPPAG